jgi:hypothetical protein
MNNMNNNNVAILVDAKNEYTKQLINILKRSIYINISTIYTEAETTSKKNEEINNVLFRFQNLLEKIPKWKSDIIDTKYSQISETSKCDWIEDLLTAVFITHTKILTLVNKSQFNKKINLKIPKPQHFIHLCFIECAREFWKNPFLFSKDNLSQYEFQKNVKDCETIISDCINETIRKQLPVKHILKEYLGDFYNSEPEDDIDITEEYSKKHLNNIKKMIKKELDRNEDTDEENIETIIKDEIKKQIKEKKEKSEEPKEDSEETKEEPKKETKEEPKKETKEEPKEEPKEDSEETKEEPKEEPKEDSEETKEEPKEDSEETKEEPKEEPKEDNEEVDENEDNEEVDENEDNEEVDENEDNEEVDENEDNEEVDENEDESEDENDLNISDIDDLDLELEFDNFEDELDNNTESVNLDEVSRENKNVEKESAFSFIE